MGEMK